MKKLRILLTIFFIVLTIVSCQKDVVTYPPNEPLKPMGKIYIQSKPTGALIYLNNKNMGIKTPDTLNLIPTGKQIITLKLPLYSDTTFSVDINNDITKNVFIDFSLNSKNVGKIYVESHPVGADIWLNDSLLNRKAPFTLSRLIPGNYKVKCTYALCRPDSTNVTVSASTTVNTFLTLEDTSSWVSYNTKNSPLVSEHIFALACDKKDKIWIGTDQGLMSFTGRDWSIYIKDNSALQSNYINCIAVDNQNRKWIGTMAGLYVFDDGIWTDYSAYLPDNHVTVLTFDKMNNVWIGTYHGVVKFSNGNWTTLNTDNSGLKENMITSLAVDNSNRIWIGTAHNYINIFDGHSWKYYDNTNIDSRIRGTGKEAYIIQAMQMDDLGNMWVSFLSPSNAYGILGYFNGTGWQIFSNPGYLFNYTFTMFVKNNFLILGNNNGISSIECYTYSFQNYEYANSALQLYKIQALTVDSQNNIWVGTLFNGIGKFKKGSF